MSYRVEWTVEAENDLAAFWNAASDRGAVATASAWIDARLRANPLHFGEPRVSSVHRTAARAPIGVEFEVIEDDKHVIVHGVFALD